MIKRKILTAALVAVGAFVSLEHSSVAQTGGTTSPGGTTTSPSDTTTPPGGTTSPGGSMSAPGGSMTPSSGSSTGSSSQSSLSSSDKRFLLQAAQGGTAEVQLGQLATQKASSDTVKQYAQRMVDEHSQANNQLAALAAQKGVTLPTDIGSKNQAVYDQLSKLSGTAFDRAYLKAAGVKAHSQQADLFKKEAQKGQDPDLKALATQLLPTIEDHLQTARAITEGKTAGSSSTPGGSMSSPSSGGSMGSPSGGGSMSSPSGGGSMSSPSSGGSMGSPSGGGSMGSPSGGGSMGSPSGGSTTPPNQ